MTRALHKLQPGPRNFFIRLGVTLLRGKAPRCSWRCPRCPAQGMKSSQPAQDCPTPPAATARAVCSGCSTARSGSCACRQHARCRGVGESWVALLSNTCMVSAHSSSQGPSWVRQRQRHSCRHRFCLTTESESHSLSKCCCSVRLLHSVRLMQAATRNGTRRAVYMA